MAAKTATETPPVAEAAAPTATKKGTPAAGGKAKGAKKSAKDSKGAKDSKASKGAEANADGPSVAAHPRAARAVARAKGWGGLAGFLIGGYMSLPTNTVADAMLRALLAGVVCYVTVWAGAVFLWRRLVMLEIKGREQQLIAAALAARAKRELPAAPAPRAGARAAS